MTSPSNLVAMRPREVWCPQCKVDTISDVPGAKCEKCGEFLITILYSSLTGERLTGANELAKRDSSPASRTGKP